MVNGNQMVIIWGLLQARGRTQIISIIRRSVKTHQYSGTSSHFCRQMCWLPLDPTQKNTSHYSFNQKNTTPLKFHKKLPLPLNPLIRFFFLKKLRISPNRFWKKITKRQWNEAALCTGSILLGPSPSGKSGEKSRLVEGCGRNVFTRGL